MPGRFGITCPDAIFVADVFAGIPRKATISFHRELCCRGWVISLGRLTNRDLSKINPYREHPTMESLLKNRCFIIGLLITIIRLEKYQMEGLIRFQ